MFSFHTEMSTCLMAGDREVMIMYSVMCDEQSKIYFLGFYTDADSLLITPKSYYS